jgi:hypothetical protein
MPSYANQFRAPVFQEQTIVNKRGKTIGVIRIKPSSVLWKPSGKSTFYSVSLNNFTKWISHPKTPANKTKS